MASRVSYIQITFDHYINHCCWELYTVYVYMCVYIYILDRLKYITLRIRIIILYQPLCSHVFPSLLNVFAKEKPAT